MVCLGSQPCFLVSHPKSGYVTQLCVSLNKNFKHRYIFCVEAQLLICMGSISSIKMWKLDKFSTIYHLGILYNANTLHEGEVYIPFRCILVFKDSGPCNLTLLPHVEETYSHLPLPPPLLPCKCHHVSCISCGLFWKCRQALKILANSPTHP